MKVEDIAIGSIVSGPLLPEPVEVLALVPLGGSVKLIGRGCKTGLVRDPVLTPGQLALLSSAPSSERFDGDPALFRLGIEAQRLALAHEYDPFFSLSFARVDPLPHQLEAVYDYFLKENPTLAYKLGMELSRLTDHFLLMTATPHKGDSEHFCRFLALLDRDVYGNVSSLEEAMRRGDAPFYLRRTKEALVTFPDPDTGEAKKLFTKREVKTTTFELNDEEFEFYEALTKFVEDQSLRALSDETAAGRAIGFIMAMLQRRMASSVYAVRRSLERMRAKREEILEDPEAYRKKRLEKRLETVLEKRGGQDFDELHRPRGDPPGGRHRGRGAILVTPATGAVPAHRAAAFLTRQPVGRTRTGSFEPQTGSWVRSVPPPRGTR